jgi:hypothetical protein
VEPAEYEAWGRAVVERAAELIVAEIPAAQLPEAAKTKRAIRAGRASVSRHVTFRHPDQPAERSVWLFAVPAGHAHDLKPPHDRVGAGLMQDPDTELSQSRFAAGLNRAPAFAWKTHVDARHEGYRLAIKVDAESDAPERRAEELAAEVLRNLRLAGLIGAP